MTSATKVNPSKRIVARCQPACSSGSSRTLISSASQVANAEASTASGALEIGGGSGLARHSGRAPGTFGIIRQRPRPNGWEAMRCASVSIAASGISPGNRRTSAIFGNTRVCRVAYSRSEPRSASGTVAGGCTARQPLKPSGNAAVRAPGPPRVPFFLSTAAATPDSAEPGLAPPKSSATTRCPRTRVSLTLRTSAFRYIIVPCGPAA